MIVAPPEPVLKRYAAEARAEGKTAIEKPVPYPHNSTLVFFDDWIRRVAVVVATPTRLAAAQTVLPHTIVNWNIFKVVRTLKTAAVADILTCNLYTRPSDLHLNVDEIAVQLPGGEAVVDGVTVRLVRPESGTKFLVGEEYLLIGPTCSNRNLPVTDTFDVYRVLPTGELAGQEWNDDIAARIKSLGSVDGLQKYIETMPKQ